jgi:hypothetical protein
MKYFNKKAILIVSFIIILLFSNRSILNACVNGVYPNSLSFYYDNSMTLPVYVTGGCISFQAYSTVNWIYVWTDEYSGVVNVYADVNDGPARPIVSNTH